jgi:hypothetical protein
MLLVQGLKSSPPSSSLKSTPMRAMVSSGGRTLREPSYLHGSNTTQAVRSQNSGARMRDPAKTFEDLVVWQKAHRCCHASLFSLKSNV